ncbi:MAG: 16S rRNA (guanine(966)-N(2))-methyltransferase RsmD [Candidatus Rokubacteria bacterium]|nr:16S rRNA (guanine(966)-N(2))-methyltransferase RsmD [Candidatus Rokubacteria bacterium]
MRVLAGDLKGRRLTTPAGRTTRPTSDQVRIACLDTLMPYLAGGPFLDLFAGAGGVGIEALSRGAPSAVFVEQEVRALRALRENVERLGLSGRARVLRTDGARALERLAEAGARFAVVFLDPPYDSPRARPALERLAEGSCLLPGAVVVLQHATKSPPPSALGALAPWKARRFGETTLTFFRSPA